LIGSFGVDLMCTPESPISGVKIHQDGRLVRVPPDPDGLYRSKTVPGLWLDPVAFLDDDGPAIVATLERGLATEEHAAFVNWLANAKR
jgi:hypothetical protein